MPGSSYLVDTNILLRLVQPDSPEYGTIRQCTDRLWAGGADLFYTSQNLAEFWNVCTRPADRNGFGFSVAETDERAALISGDDRDREGWPSKFSRGGMQTSEPFPLRPDTSEESVHATQKSSLFFEPGALRWRRISSTRDPPIRPPLDSTAAFVG